MKIEGERIILRAIELTDSDVLLKLINDADIESVIGGWSFPVSSYQQEEWIKNQIKSENSVLRCMIEIKENNLTIGTCILTDIDYKNGTAEVHIKLLEKGQNRGYGSETINLLVNYAFHELRLNCLFASILENNVNSINLFRKCKFIEEGTLRQRVFKNGSYHNIKIFSKLVSDAFGNR